jgi:hypothetical protein
MTAIAEWQAIGRPCEPLPGSPTAASLADGVASNDRRCSHLRSLKTNNAEDLT